MRKLIMVGIVVAVVIGFVVYFQQSESAGREKAREDMARLDTEMRAQSSAIQADIEEQQARLIALKLGPVAGDEYRLCKNSPPKLKGNRDKCRQFEEYLKKQDAEEKQHPSW